jgi:hypothetical protein
VNFLLHLREFLHSFPVVEMLIEIFNETARFKMRLHPANPVSQLSVLLIYEFKLDFFFGLPGALAH